MQHLKEQLESSIDSPSLITLIDTIADTCREIAHRLQHGPMYGVLGSAGEENVQGETQKKLDVVSNDLLKECLINLGTVRALASEEEEFIVEGHPNGDYLVAFDPLDGSSNIDINSLVGTIFSIFKAPSTDHVSEQNFLQPGRQQVAAGYVLYGPAAILVLTTGHGVDMYTLDLLTDTFRLTQQQITISPDTNEFGINMSNQRFWDTPMKNYISELLAGTDGPRGKNFNMRWVAAMVADVHRVLSRGGIFSYPWDKREPQKPGKLRLMYEANPMAMLIEQAGGAAYAECTPILDIQPTDIHQRVPVTLGSKNEVDICVTHHLKH
jgi:fructose-1,6-bisphosphatase I